MTTRTKLANSFFKAATWGFSFIFLLAPAIVCAQQLPGGTQQLDAWRARMNEQLDMYLTKATSEPQQVHEPLLRVERNEATTAFTIANTLTAQPEEIGGHFNVTVDGILRTHGLPPQLISVVAVESGFKPWALSPKGALGLWQLMPDTARRYGLVVNEARDDRRDPAKSTEAAAQYLKDLYGQFGNWPLALAAYNAGEVRVQNAIDRFQTRDFWTLSAKLALPDETRRYVPAVLFKAGGESSLSIAASPSVSNLKPFLYNASASSLVYATASPNGGR